jgi:hypothetical protein
LVEIVLGASIALVVVPFIHEAAHGLAALVLGAKPAFGVGPGYAYTTFREPMGRWAYLTVGLAPLVSGSVSGMLLAVAWAGGREWVIFACIVNAAGAIGDLWMSWRILKLPRNAIYYDLADGFAALVPSHAFNQRPTLLHSAPPD